MSKRPLLAVLVILLSALFATPAYAAGDDVKYYVVTEEYNGQPEYLYEIAERFLGDGERHLEIFELNKGRTQPDGLVVDNPEIIEPGWVLQLPPDAKGAGVQTGPLPLLQPSPSSVAPSDPPPAAAAEPAKEAEPGSFPWLVVGLLAGALVLGAAAAVSFWIYRRGQGSMTPGTAVIVRRDDGAALTIDHALRVLATVRGEQGRPMPPLRTVTLSTGTISLGLAAPEDDAPAPWTSDEAGNAWTAELRELRAAAEDATPADPYPRLVTVGESAGDRVLLDLGQAKGLIAVDGDKRAQRAVVDGWAAELVGNPWSKGVKVVRCGFGTPLAGATTAGTVREALPALHGREGVLFLAGQVSGQDATDLQAFLTAPDRDWAVVMLGGAREAPWRFTIHADGTLDTGHLGLSVRAAGAAA